MGKFVKGEIVVVPFPFSDLSASKRRPALVLVDLPGDDIILCQITSQNVKDSMSIHIDTTDVTNGKLSNPSNLRPNRLFTADENIIQYILGQLKSGNLNDIISTIVTMFTN